MTIQEELFKLETGSSPKRFDLYLMSTIKGKKGSEDRQEFKLEGYDMSISSALETVAHFLTRQQMKEEVVTLKQYLTTLYEISNQLSAKYL